MDIKALVKQMTVEEKASLCSGADYWYIKKVDRLGTPEIMMSDGPHGLRKQHQIQDNPRLFDGAVESTCYPTASGVACSWNKELLYKLGEALGDEAKGEGISILLGPGVNMKRSPLCGRNFEYYSEDPYLAGKLAANYINGVQSKGVGTSIKHFAVNNQEHRRHCTNPIVDMRTLREIYLTAFEIAVKESNPATIMHSYNCLNGDQVSKSKWLLNDILRDEWKYDGLVISDWHAMNDRVTSLDAGSDLEMPGSFGVRDALIVKAVKEGKLDEAVLDRAAERVLKTVYKYLPDENAKKVDLKAMSDFSAKVAEESMVLLKNDAGILPLNDEKPLAVIGAFAKNARYQGKGSSFVNAPYVDEILSCMTGRNKGNIEYAAGYSLEGDLITPDEALINEAVETAKRCGRAVIFAGIPENIEAEGRDRPDMSLPASHNALIERVAEAVPETVVVLHIGSPAEMPWLDKVSTLFCAYLGGGSTGRAITSLLYGDANPSGKLAETFPVKLEDTPAYLNFPGANDNVVYAEGVFIGYRYYQKKKMKVNFPFGYGLSYTEFSYDDIKVDGDKVTVKITNVGKVAGKEAVQLYVGDDAPIVERPVMELKGFEKVELAPGESKYVEFTLDDRSFAFYDVRTNSWRVHTGDYTIYVGRNSLDTPLTAKVHKVDKAPLVLPITMNTAVYDIMTTEAYEPIREKLILGIIQDKFRNEVETLGVSMDTPIIFARRNYTLRMFIKESNGKMTDEKIQSFIDEANAKVFGNK